MIHARLGVVALLALVLHRAGAGEPPVAEQDLLFDGPEDASDVFVLAHGAGVPMDAPFMEAIARGVAARGIRVVRFEFPYMKAIRRGEQRSPDPETVLRRTFLSVLEKLGGGRRLVIGGKSLGGRIASLIADDAGVRGLVCLGYPFHAAGRGAEARITPLNAVETPTLVVQGARDPLGSREEVPGYDLSPKVRVVWIDGADHSFVPRSSSGRTEGQNLEAAAVAVAEFVKDLSPAPGPTPSRISGRGARSVPSVR